MLTVIEGRVLGCLMEKERTVPDQYPLSMNALVLACNQSSSREPIMALDEFEVDASITSMKTQGLVRIVHPSHGRSVTRHRQVADEKLELDEAAAAVVAVLLVRGPQTVAELRTRTERLHTFDSAAEVDACLHALAESSLVQLLDRQVGQKEQRWQQLIAEEAEQVSGPAAVLPASVAGASRATESPSSKSVSPSSNLLSPTCSDGDVHTSRICRSSSRGGRRIPRRPPDGSARDDDRGRSCGDTVADALRTGRRWVGFVGRSRCAGESAMDERLTGIRGPCDLHRRERLRVAELVSVEGPEHGKVVPTWNYETVHIRGQFVVHDEAEWKRASVTPA